MKENIRMDSHRYRVGQTVRFVKTNTSNAFGGTPPGNFRILRLLPEYKGSKQYRVESISDNHQRVAIESEIVSQ
jgi:hypothetical protein